MVRDFILLPLQSMGNVLLLVNVTSHHTSLGHHFGSLLRPPEAYDYAASTLLYYEGPILCTDWKQQILPSEYGPQRNWHGYQRKSYSFIIYLGNFHESEPMVYGEFVAVVGEENSYVIKLSNKNHIMIEQSLRKFSIWKAYCKMNNKLQLQFKRWIPRNKFQLNEKKRKHCKTWMFKFKVQCLIELVGKLSKTEGVLISINSGKPWIIIGEKGQVQLYSSIGPRKDEPMCKMKEAVFRRIHSGLFFSCLYCEVLATLRGRVADGIGDPSGDVSEFFGVSLFLVN